MAGLDTNKISNIPGTVLPQKLIEQLNLRSTKNTQDSRSNDNLLFLANKSAWVRLVSSIDIISQSDIEYFRGIVGETIKNKEDLSKQFVLFGGTSKYLESFSAGSNSKSFTYTKRAGLGKNGSYGMLGDEEIKKYGYRPMPGITSVSIETLGRLGSLRQATINFKCWDKSQLDIIDALYFKLGYTMFLEWGNTFFYSSTNPNKLQSSELYSIDPFIQNLTKEEITVQISKNIKDSEYNYDAMLGIVTNFNFEYNQEGGYDCSLKLTALGILSDSTKINNPSTLANILAEEIVLYNNTIKDIDRLIREEQLKKQKEQEKSNELAKKQKNNQKLTLDKLLADSGVKYDGAKKEFTNNAKDTYPADKLKLPEYADLSFKTKEGEPIFVLRRLKGFIPLSPEKIENTKVTLNGKRVVDILNSIVQKTTNTDGTITSKAIDIANGENWNKPNFLSEAFTLYGFGELYSQRQDVILSYLGASGNTYGIKINRAVYGIDPKNSKVIKAGIVYRITDEEFANQFKNILTTPNTFLLESIDFENQITRGTNRAFTIKIGVPFTKDVKVENETIRDTFTVDVTLQFEDSSFIESFTIEGVDQPVDFIANQVSIAAQNKQESTREEEQNKPQEPSVEQIAQSLSSQSGLELALRTIQVHALGRAAQTTQSKDINKVVYTLSMTEDLLKSGQPFYKQIFTNGIFNSCIEKLVKKEVKDSAYTTKEIMNPKERFEIQAKYGFATELMAGREEISKFNGLQVEYKELLKAFVIPYEINQEIIKGTTVTHPVYIPLGLLLMLLNHNCTSYDVNNEASQTPLVYIDFNPNLNFLLSSRRHLSTNPWVTLIPFEGSNADYLSLFQQNIVGVENNQIVITPLSGSEQSTPLFDLEGEDRLSSQIPSLKYNPTDPYSAYKGRLMNVLLNVDYLVDLIRSRTTTDPLNSVYLKPFLEIILADLNKHLGNFNILRLSYNDGGNTYQIVDDQVMPPMKGEVIVQPASLGTQYKTVLPLIGKNSIAKNLSIKTDISSKLANMLAISSNYNYEQKAQMSTEGSSFGYVNTNYKDRYIPIKGQLTGSFNPDLNSIKVTAIQFNQSIKDFYSTITPSQANISQVTGYYIDKMAIQKNLDYPTRASAPIPLSVDFTIDGASGFVMGQGFTLPSELIPYTYNIRNLQNQKGLGPENIDKVGFFVVGLTNTIENNQWNTTIRANMTYLKYATDFQLDAVKPQTNKKQFEIGNNNQITNYVSVEKSVPPGRDAAIKIAKTFFQQKGYSDIQISAIIGALLQESQLNPNAINSDSGAYGIAQWLGVRKDKLFQKQNYSSLEVQLAFIIEEFNSTESRAGRRLKDATTLEEAIAAMASYERYAGVTISATYQDVLVAAETGDRIGYSKYIYKNYYNI